MSSVSQVPFDSYVPKVAIVTGGTQGIGYAIVHRLADDGFDIAINDTYGKEKELNTVAKEVRKKGRRAITVIGDVSSETDVVVLIDDTVRNLGSVDVMVANAGIMLLGGILELSVEELEATHAVNVRGTFLCLKWAGFQMVQQGRGGRLIVATSTAGKQGGPNIAAYSASKFAIRGLVQSASIDLHKYGITVNAYAPGVIRTPMTRKVGENDPKLKEALAAMPNAEPEVIASIVSYLAKPESYFVNGQSVSVNGGGYFD